MGLATIATIAACGQAGSAGDAPSSARFEERSTFLNEGKLIEERIVGAVDWKQAVGWAKVSYSGDHYSAQSHRMNGRRCLTAEGPWIADCGIGLSGRFDDPSALLAQISRSGVVERLGDETVDGVPTTKYRVSTSGSIDDPYGLDEGPIELWVDEDGIVRRLRQRDPEKPKFSTIRKYYDFGVRVDAGEGAE
jgi:hypothetical protein